MRSVWLLCFSLVFVSCVKPTETKVPSYEEAQATVLRQGNLVVKPIEARMNYKCTDKPTHNVDPPGVLLTNDRATCTLAQIAERDRLRKELEAERLRSRTKEIILEASLKRAAELNRSTWWDRYGGGVLLSTGTVIGVAITVGIVYALTGGNQIKTAE